MLLENGEGVLIERLGRAVLALGVQVVRHVAVALGGVRVLLAQQFFPQGEGTLEERFGVDLHLEVHLVGEFTA